MCGNDMYMYVRIHPPRRAVYIRTRSRVRSHTHTRYAHRRAAVTVAVAVAVAIVVPAEQTDINKMRTGGWGTSMAL